MRHFCHYTSEQNKVSKSEVVKKVITVADFRMSSDDMCLLYFIFILWGGTRFLRMPTLRPASQGGPMRNFREGTSVVLRDTIRLT